MIVHSRFSCTADLPFSCVVLHPFGRFNFVLLGDQISKRSAVRIATESKFSFSCHFTHCEDFLRGVDEVLSWLWKGVNGDGNGAGDGDVR